MGRRLRWELGEYRCGFWMRERLGREKEGGGRG